MKRLYARLVLWLVRPALDLQSDGRVPTASQLAALADRIDTVQSASFANAHAITAERAARQCADMDLRAQFTAQSREF